MPPSQSNLSNTAIHILVRVERRVEKTPSDADRGERLHFEVARRRSASQSRPLEVDEQRNTTGDRGEQQEDAGADPGNASVQAP